MAPSKRRNPFYVLLVPVGVAFVVTAFAYGLMAFQVVNGGVAGRASQSHPLSRWLRLHGDETMLGELAALAALTVAAIATDSWWAGPRLRDVPATPATPDA